MYTSMHLKILLPYGIFSEEQEVSTIVAETRQGSFGLMPNRLDCVASLVPGILTYETKSKGEVNVAVDQGMMVKTGAEVVVSVRNAIGGTDLGKLHEAIEQEFLQLDEREKDVRSVLAKLESGFLRRLQKIRED